MIDTLQQIHQWFKCLLEMDDIIEFRCFPPNQAADDLHPRKYAWTSTRQLHQFWPWMIVDAVDQCVQTLMHFNHPAGVRTKWGTPDEDTGRLTNIETIYHVPLNVYCSANPRTHLGGTKAEDVALARSLFADLDDVSTEDAHRLINASGLPKPTLSVWSGHGVHLYWRLLEPITNMAHWTRLQKRIIQALHSDPKVHDAPRMMRLPGFINHNGKPSKVFILDADPAHRYDLGLFHQILPHPVALTQKNSAKITPKEISGDGDLQVPEVSGEEKLRRATGFMESFSPAQEGARNSTLFDLSANLTEKFDLSLEQVQTIASTFNSRCPEPLPDAEVEEVTEKAHQHIQKKGKRRGTWLATVESEPFQEPQGEVVSLEVWREQMKEKRLASLTQPGVLHFDGSPPGAGKSTADLVAMKKAGQSITFLPTHEGCRELSTRLAKEGLTSASYPPVNEQTCQRFGTKSDPGDAFWTQQAGLNVGAALCPDCQFSKTCIYQRLRQEAASTGHAIATHARSASSHFEPAKNKPVIFIHENWLNLLRPTVRVSANPSTAMASLQHLRDVSLVSHEASKLAATWDDHEKQAFFQHLLFSTQELIEKLGNCSENNQRVEQLPIKDARQRPERWEYAFFRAMRDTGIRLHGDGLRLSLGYACGEIETVCLVLDEIYREKQGAQQAEKSVVPALIGVWRVDPPEHAVVWFEDGTGSADLLRQLTNQNVIDQTPQGRLAYELPPIQYPQDVTRRTSPNIVRGLLRGVLVRHPQAKKIGVLTLSCHVKTLEDLEPRWRKRIQRIDYFGSGKDRASNAWLDCDLIIILGTPRVSPSTVRQGLIQIGKIEEAALDGKWSTEVWTGKTPSGDILPVNSLGYRHPSWRYVHRMLVRDSMTQAIGRGRGVTKDGVQVVVVSTECLGILLAPSPLQLVKDQESLVLEACYGLTAVNAKYIIVAENAVSTHEVAQQVSLGERQTRIILSSLSSLGLLKRKGERGGWIVDAA